MKLEFIINKPLPHVFDYLTDMKKFVSVHPIIYKMDDLGENNYKVYEKLMFLYIPCTFRYKAKVAGHANDHVNISALVMGMISIKMDFYLKDQSGQTLVTEEVNFRSFLPVKPVMQKIFRKQHAELFKNIDKAL